MKPSYHTKACQRFLFYLIDHFQIDTKVTLHLDPVLTNPVNNIPIQGSAQLHKDGSATIRLSTSMNSTRRKLLFALAHEFGHVVQYSKGFKPDIRKPDWRKELEATQLGIPVFIKFMREHYNTAIHYEPLPLP